MHTSTCRIPESSGHREQMWMEKPCVDKIEGALHATCLLQACFTNTIGSGHTWSAADGGAGARRSCTGRISASQPPRSGMCVKASRLICAQTRHRTRCSMEWNRSTRRVHSSSLESHQNFTPDEFDSHTGRVSAVL